MTPTKDTGAKRRVPLNITIPAELIVAAGKEAEKRGIPVSRLVELGLRKELGLAAAK